MEEDLGAKLEGEEEAKSSVREDAETSGGITGVDQSVGYIVWFADAVELYQKKNQNCFWCSSPDHLVKHCPRDLGKTAWKLSLNVKEGMIKKGGQAPQKPVDAQLASLDKAPKHKDILKKLSS